MSKKVLIPLAQGCEELEAVTLIDLFRRAGLDVLTAGLDNEVVTCSRGVRILPDTTLEQVKKATFDLVVLPGGMPGTDHLDRDPRIQSIIKEHFAAGKYIGAICAAPKVLASAGLLEGKIATGFPGTLERLDLKNTRLSNAAVEVDGKIVTSRGPGTAIDFALTLIELVLDREKCIEVKNQLKR